MSDSGAIAGPFGNKPDNPRSYRGDAGPSLRRLEAWAGMWEAEPPRRDRSGTGAAARGRGLAILPHGG